MPAGDLLGALAEAVRRGAHRAVRRRIDGEAATTLTALLWSGSRLALAHIGDTRAYRLRDGELGQITHDHTYVQSLVDEGRLTTAEAAAHPQRSLLVQSPDGSGDAPPTCPLHEARAGDRYLLCSDGLAAAVPAPATCCDVLRRPGRPAAGPRRADRRAPSGRRRRQRRPLSSPTCACRRRGRRLADRRPLAVPAFRRCGWLRWSPRWAARSAWSRSLPSSTRRPARRRRSVARRWCRSPGWSRAALGCGALADRRDRRRVLLAAQSGLAVTYAGLWAQAALGGSAAGRSCCWWPVRA